MAITYTDKVSIQSNPNPDENKVTAADMNEIKSVVNTNETALGSKVPTSRILTIDGTAFDLSSDRSWTTSGGTDKFPQIYNVTQNGLVGDGATDNAAAFTALIAAATEGSFLYFPPGDYELASGVVITKKLHLIGHGVSSKIYTNANNITLIDYDYTGNAEVADVIIKDLTLYCQPSITPVSPSVGLSIQNSSSRLRMTNVYVGGFYNNIALTNPVEYVLDKLYCTAYVDTGLDMRSSGIYVDAGDGSIINSYFIPATYDSVYSIFHRNGGGLKITNTKFNFQGGATPKKAQYHYYYDGDGATVDLNISNNSFENCSTAYIRVGVSGSGVFREICILGNDIGDTTSSGADGIILSGVDYVAIVGNSMKSAGSGTRNAIQLTSVTNATIYNTYQGWSANVVNVSGSTNINSPIDASSFLTPSNDDILQRKSGVWTNRTIAQLITDLQAGGLSATLDGYRSITGTDSVTSSDYYKTIVCSGTSSDYTVTLPTASGISGKWFRFVGASALTKIVTIDADSTETINGITTRQFATGGGFVIVSDGTNWQVANETPSRIIYSPTFTGFSGTPSNSTTYSLNGKMMTIQCNTASTAASGTGLTITLPSGFTIMRDTTHYARVQSNSTYGPGIAVLSQGATTVTLFSTAAGGTISGSGNKAVECFLTFEIQ